MSTAIVAPASPSVDRPVGLPSPWFPYKNLLVPDTSTKFWRREFSVSLTSHEPATARRTPVRNLLPGTTQLENGTYWGSTSAGTGSSPVVTANFTGPASFPAWRLQLNRGAGSTGGDYSRFSASLTGLANPHDCGAAVCMKSNTGATQVVAFRAGGVERIVNVTSKWQRFTIAATTVAGTSDSLAVEVRGDGAFTQNADILIAAVQFDTSTTIGTFVDTTDAARTALVPDTDPDDPFALLFWESSPRSIPGAEGNAQVVRLFGQVPREQVTIDVANIIRPVLDDVTDGTYFAVSWDRGRTSHIFASRKTIATIQPIDPDEKAVTGTRVTSGTVAGTGTVIGTGSVSGTGTIPRTAKARSLLTLPSVVISGRFDGANFSFFASAAGSSIKASIEAGGGTGECFVAKSESSIVLVGMTGRFEYVDTSSDLLEITSGGPETIVIRRRQNTADVADTLDTRGTLDTRDTEDTQATLETHDTTDTSNLTEYYYPRASVRYFTTTANHGAQPGDFVAFYQGGRIVAKSVVISTASSTGFTCLRRDVDGKDFGAATCVFSSGAMMRIVNGPKWCNVRDRTQHVLPGLTVGISSYADITPLESELTPQKWLTAVATKPTGWAVIGTRQWGAMRGPDGQSLASLVVYSFREVQMSDAVQEEANLLG